MISNYSHDHIALDTMNIMANGQYIDINIDINIEYHYYTYSQSKQASPRHPPRNPQGIPQGIPNGLQKIPKESTRVDGTTIPI